MPLNNDDFVNIKGKLFPSYPGVLRVAIEEKGLVRLEETITDLRWMEASSTHGAGWYALATATAVFRDSDGTERTFTGIGDCGPHNCDRMIAIHAPRMAGTRAKGRTLRDALGLDECLSEELGGASTEASPPAPQQPRVSALGVRTGGPPDRNAMGRDPSDLAPNPKSEIRNPQSADPFEKIPAQHVPGPTGAEVCAECGKALTKNDLTASAANAKFLDGKKYCLTDISARRKSAIV